MTDTVKLNGKSRDKNLSLWHGFSPTPKDMMREVNFGYKFISIDPNWQLQEMTSVFGPIGEGWWIAPIYSEVVTGNRVIVKCELHLLYKTKEQLALEQKNMGELDSKNTIRACGVGPVVGCSELVSDKGKFNNSAYKIAMTDAMTKAFSLLGMSHAVFQGRFDDRKSDERPPQEVIESARQSIQNAKEESVLNKVFDGLEEYFRAGLMDRTAFEYLVSLIADKRKSLHLDATEHLMEKSVPARPDPNRHEARLVGDKPRKGK